MAVRDTLLLLQRCKRYCKLTPIDIELYQFIFLYIPKIQKPSRNQNA